MTGGAGDMVMSTKSIGVDGDMGVSMGTGAIGRDGDMGMSTGTGGQRGQGVNGGMEDT